MTTLNYTQLPDDDRRLYDRVHAVVGSVRFYGTTDLQEIMEIVAQEFPKRSSDPVCKQAVNDALYGRSALEEALKKKYL